MPSDREYPARPIVGVGAVILVSPAEAGAIGWPAPLERAGVILVKRLFEPLAGQWSLPGGMLEVGETLESGVAREIAEETGLTVDVGPIVEVFDRIFRDRDSRVRYHYVLIDYLCSTARGRLRAGSDVSDVIVADPDDLAAFALTEKTLDVIREAVSMASEVSEPVNQQGPEASAFRRKNTTTRAGSLPPEGGSHTIKKE